MGKAAKKEGPVIELVGAVGDVPEKYQGVFDMFMQLHEEDEDTEWIATCMTTDTCGVFLQDGTDVPCYAVAEDDLGYSVMTTEGLIKRYTLDEVS